MGVNNVSNFTVSLVGNVVESVNAGDHSSLGSFALYVEVAEVAFASDLLDGGGLGQAPNAIPINRADAGLPGNWNNVVSFG